METKWKEQLPITGIKAITPVSGGDVNEAFRIESKDGVYFLLVQRNKSESFYAAEIEGLNLFEAANVTAPRVIDSGEIAGDAYLILSFLHEGTKGSQRQLGELVAKLHSQHEPEGRFGFDLPYQGGDISFDNNWSDNWTTIFVERRLDHLVETLLENDQWTLDDKKRYEQVRKIIVDALSNHKSKPSLLHGDLWGGNYMFLEDGTPALFDPAPLYGDREFDLGITTVFGGFTQDFYDAYERHYPMAKGAEQRLEFYRLYLLMVHLVKFGGLYARSVDQSISKILADAK
ncbi:MULTISPECIES: fructosamine kinase family protein [Staphylococcus]|uniref:Fructosamine kinase family protein n=1 Tax=Staphylococcus gallinarum TaxID=1293 RepID=A0A418HPY6_STAGA|nr:fructosamine kinase family protein [Staphylococcus gallinarum]MCD8826736.1 fructosamine kinase family protein [Staphylococcus gallinarum]PTE80034.1 fructosamine kinase [Staphylococcus gallinarum]RIL43732.1 fructosamine kinase family protein [Staphylococcus gallinarum]RIO88331.1 fructosamine kinase family protein [Staphylococcus gallinarum]